MDEEQNIQQEKEEEHLPDKNEPGDAPIPSTETKKELTDMEVHHHPDLQHHRRSWKEYLLEGLMIFIAVMLGFVAENIRESLSNKQHVRELVSQLVQDLKTDTAQLNTIDRAETEIMYANDSLASLLQLPPDKINSGQLVNLAVTSHSVWLFHPSSGAVAAIKNELHLRQFSSSKIISYISEYEKHIELLHTVQDITLRYQRTYIDPFLLEHVTAADLHAAFNKLSLPEKKLRGLSQEALTQMATDMELIRINTRELILDYGRVKTDAVNLLQYVKKQFDPQEE